MKIKLSYANATFVAILFLSFPCRASHKLSDSHVTGWMLSGVNPGAYQSGIDKSVKYSGSASAFVSSKTQDSTQWSTLMQTIKSDAYEGKRVRLSAWVKTDRLNKWCGLWMRVDKRAGSTAFDNMQDRPIKGTTDWKQYAVVLDVDTGSIDIAFGILVEGAGKIWMDAVKIEIVNSDVTLTGHKNINKVYYNKGQSLPNLSFENISSSNTPEDWSGTINTNSYKITSDRTVFHDGLASVCLKSIENNVNSNYNFGTVTGRMMPDSFKGKRVRMTGWIKTENVNGYAGLWMRVDGQNFGQVLAFDNMMNRPIKGTTDWGKYEVVLDVPNQAVNINFGALLTGKGTLWLDEIKFEVVDSYIASTSTYTSKGNGKSNYTKKRAKYIHDSATNLDFEG